MKRPRIYLITKRLKELILSVILILPISLLADLRVASVFGDNMVLQRDQAIRIWGWGEPQSTVRVAFTSQNETTNVNEDGSWEVVFPAQSGGGPYELHIMADDTLHYSNILIGEVWVCSGQSNMGMTVGGSSRVNNYKQEIKNATYPNIRLITVDRAMAAQPLDDIVVKGWTECLPESVEKFSATAYFFGRDLQKGLGNVPIGLIHTSWGGTKIEAWTSADALTQAGLFQEELEEVSRSNRVQDEQILNDYKLANKAWKLGMDSLAGNLTPKTISLMTQVHQEWKQMTIPTYWEHTKGLKDLDGIVWFQRIIELPEAWEGRDLFISLGTVDDYDRTFLNETQIGSNNSWSSPSEYSISPDLFDKGKNLLSVRVVDVNWRGGLWGREQDLFITPAAGGDTLWLKGEWKYKVVLDWADHDVVPPARPYLHNRPSVLYNAMLAPLTKFSIRGVIWYQGESNANQAHQYRTTFPLMINDWRKAWDLGDFPFLYVQLPNWGKREQHPSEANWSELRDAQLQTLILPNTSMAVTIDIGDEQDIHPKNKQDIGHRLALLALSDVYKKNITSTGPIYRSHKVRWGKIHIIFDKIAHGLKTRDARDLVGFSIAGEDGKFHWAQARIHRDRVIVSSPEVKHPVAVRYAWGANPDCNLTNTSGIPASPFKTDNWPDTTE